MSDLEDLEEGQMARHGKHGKRNLESVPLTSKSHEGRQNANAHDQQYQNGSAGATGKGRGILTLTVDVPASAPRSSETHPPARWKTPEFLFYGVCFLIVVPLMVWKPVQLSQDTHPNFPVYEHRLEEGWIAGRLIDNSDAQYRSFRNNIPTLIVLSAFFFLSKAIYLAIRRSFKSNDISINHSLFRLGFSLFFILGMHWTNTPKVLFLLSVNYGIAKLLNSSRINPALTWIFNGTVLFLIERNAGYRYSSISPALEFLDDGWQGFYPRWFIPFNITMLRLVSFNMDYYWACRRTGPLAEAPGDQKQRSTTPHTLDTYSYANYLTYVLYPPLYIAGPIMTFNDFTWQQLRPLSLSKRSVVFPYLIRFASCLFTMELIQHFMYVVAIKDTNAWQGDSPFELSMIGFWNLIIVWLKLLLPWRFFRLWALADGVDPPENMIRCMANNYSTLGFWRSWHRSYNLWIVRYIYIPLGGTKNLIFSSLLIFTFVALWHDRTFKLLAWGWLVSLFILPEVLSRFALPASKNGHKWWFRHVCAIGGVGNILMMMTANLVGFVIGVDGITYLWEQLIGSLNGLGFLFIACVCLFIAVQVMFEYREEEMRNGIYRKC